jgi:hypothetical protein
VAGVVLGAGAGARKNVEQEHKPELDPAQTPLQNTEDQIVQGQIQTQDTATLVLV